MIVAIDPGKAFNRAWLTTGEHGLIGDPVSLRVLRDGFDQLGHLIKASGIEGSPVIGIEATGPSGKKWGRQGLQPGEGSLKRARPGPASGKTKDGSSSVSGDPPGNV